MCEPESIYDSDYLVEDSVRHIDQSISSIKHKNISVGSDKKATNEEIILDNAAEISIFNNKRMFRRMYEAEAICVDGVNEDSERIFTSTAGETLFGEVYYSKKAVGNIQSFPECVDKMYNVEYDKEGDSFTDYMIH
jgi:hypothetical protein